MGQALTVTGVVDCHVHIQPWTQLKPAVAPVLAGGRADQAKIDAAVTMNSTDAVVSMVSKVALATVRRVIER